MANSSAHRLLPDNQRHHHHHHRQATSGVASSGAGGLSVATLHQHLAASDGARSGSEGPIGHHQVGSSGKAHFKPGHQRRQSVARLLPDISKLRLLSWLVEASSELINCDIAIMDGVYAKLNRSRESLLFWDSNSTQQQQQQQSPSKQQQVPQHPPRRPPPPPPSVQPVANRIVISQRSRQQRKLSSQQQQQLQQQLQVASRNHHSLPITNYDASSLAAVSMSPSLGSPKTHKAAVTATRSMGRSTTTAGSSVVDTDSLFSSFRSGANANVASTSSNQQQPIISSDSNVAANLCDNEDSCDSNNQSDDDDNSSAASSSSGIHGGETSLSSHSGHSSASSSSSSAASTASGDLGGSTNTTTGGNSTQVTANDAPVMSSAELLSEKIRRTVMKHNYLQSLLVNIIRQHDRQRDLMNQQRRRQMSIDQFNLNRIHQQQLLHPAQQRIDLADIADALDDGCFCLCHSSRVDTTIDEPISCGGQSQQNRPGRSSTLPSNSSSGSNRKLDIVAGNNQVPATLTRKMRRLKKSRTDGGGGQNELNRQDIISLLSDKLCENCFETHYWLHGSSLELMQLPQPTKGSQRNSSVDSNSPSTQSQESNAIIAKRNAIFIKLVQQEVRSTISKSIELIDLIRKEIKLPESIKQKQLMRCFSTSIQLLTSVGNYVVPAQDISSFIPAEVVGQQETTLFSLPSSDFDHLLLYPSPVINSSSSSHHHHHQTTAASHITTTRNSNYHLAQAPDIPLRRRYNARKLLEGSCSSSILSESSLSTSTVAMAAAASVATPNNQKRSNSQEDNKIEQALSSNLQKLKTSDAKCATIGSTTTTTTSSSNANANTNTITTTTATTGGSNNNTQAQVQDSSSGASSNNSSASSSIARGAVQQSSLIRAQTSNAILDGKTSHDLSFEAIASLSRQQQTEDDFLYQSRPKFWQSSKFNFIKKLLHVKQQRLLRQQSKDRRIYNNKVQNKFRLVMKDLTHFNKSQQLLATENGVNSLLTSMRNVLEFGLYLTLKLY